VTHFVYRFCIWHVWYVVLAFLASTVVKKALLPLQLFAAGHSYFPGDSFVHCIGNITFL